MKPKPLQWHEETRAVASLKPYDKNPRRFTDRRMTYPRESIDRFGFADPEIINTDGTVIGGHARLLVASERGETDIRCSVPSRKLAPDEVQELCFRLNANIGGEFDFDILANEFDLAELESWGAIEIPGFEEAFLAEAEPETIDAEPQVSKAEELNRKWKVKTGDVWQIGGHVLHCADNRDVLPTLGRFDLLLCDPPYGVGEDAARVKSRGKKARPTDYGQFDWDASPVEYEHLQSCMFSAHSSIVWGGNYYPLPPSPSWLIWDKVNTGDFADCEMAWSDLGCAVRLFRLMWNGMLREGEQRGVKRVHPTQKPVELMRWCISLADKKKRVETILDPFAGSGTTLLAAANLGRVCTAVEREPTYCAVILDRMATAFPDLKAERLRK